MNSVTLFPCRKFIYQYKFRFAVCCNNLVTFVILYNYYLVFFILLLCLPLVNKADHFNLFSGSSGMRPQLGPVSAHA